MGSRRKEHIRNAESRVLRPCLQAGKFSNRYVYAFSGDEISCGTARLAALAFAKESITHSLKHP